MKRVLILLVMLISIFAFTACFGGGDSTETPENESNSNTGNNGETSNDGKIKVMLVADSGVEILSDNPVYISEGENAVFNVSISKTCVVDTVSHGVLENGTLTVSGLTRDTSVKITTIDYGYDLTVMYKFMMFGEDSDTSDLQFGADVNAGTKVKLSANEQYKIFLGWSLNNYTTDSDKMISKSREFEMTLEPSMANASGIIKVYANYADTDSYYYDPNGGTIDYNSTLAKTNSYYTVSKEGDMMKLAISGDYLSLVESVCLFYDDGTFTRDGYVLAEYNTKPDGSGTSYSLGSKYYIDNESGELPVLYCIWKKATDASYFTYEDFNYPCPVKASNAPHWKENGVIITSYIGNESEVVIPESIDGKYVIAIAESAFLAKNMETLVLPRFIEKVETDAFVNCSSLETIYYPDSIYDISNESFNEDSYTSLKHLYVNATMAPRHSNTDGGAYSVKLSRILASQNENRIIVIAGSSTFQGFASEYMEALLDGEYRVINFGTTRTTNGMIYLEAMEHLAHENDIIVYAPENSTYMAGENELYWKTLRDLESMYNIYRFIDISNYTNVFSSFADYNQNYRYSRSPQHHEAIYDVIFKGTVNKFGEYQNPKRVSLVDSYVDSYFITLNNRYKSKYDFEWNDEANQEANKDYTDPENITWESIDSDRLKNAMNEAIASAKKSGAKVYFGFSPVDASKLVTEAQNKEWILAYDELIKDIYDFDGVLGSAVDYVYAHKYFYDCAFHLNDVGRTYRTYRMYLDICEVIGIDPTGFTSVGQDFEGCIFTDKDSNGVEGVSKDGMPLEKVDFLE